ncbi:MAG: hypothetical protein IKN55_10925 [Oscillospiraceae bacterium]|nr:hypothetical protein [Oscillospiraceae bacterium]
MNEKLREVMADEAFVKSCIEAENEEAVQKLFAGKGIEMSLTEIEIMKEMVGAVADGKISEEQLEKLSQAGELSEDELEQAAGGWSPLDLVSTLKEVIPEGRSSLLVANEEQVFQRFASVPKILGCVAAVATIGVAVGGIIKYKDEIGSGISSAYSYVKENITRW